MGALLVVVGTMLGARAFGVRATPGVARRLHPATRLVVEIALGLLLISYAVLGVALAGLATRPVLGGVWVVLALTGVGDVLLGRLRRTSRRRPGPGSQVDTADTRRRRLLLGLLLLAWSGWALAASTLPPTAIDELVYQLEIPRRTLETGSLPAFVDNIYGYFPQGGGMLLLLGMALAGPAAAKLTHAAAGLLVAVALYGATRRLAPEAPALLAPAAFLAVPTVLVLGAWAYVDLIFTLFLLLALLCALEIAEEGPRLSWALLAGLLAGGAWTVKYTGLQASLLLALVLLVDHLRDRRAGFPWAAALLPATALLMAAPWLLRNWWTTGWPMFPFRLPGFELADAINWGADRAALYLRWLSQYGGGPERGVVERLLSPVLVFLTARFEGGAFDGMVGPAFLLVPALWIGRRPGRRLDAVGLFCLAYLLYWTSTTTQVRFLVPALAPLSLLLAAAVARPTPGWRRAVAVLLLLIGVGFAVAEVASWHPERYWFGTEDRRAWVDRRVGVASVYHAVEDRLGPDDRVYLVNMRHLGFMLRRPPAYLGRPTTAAWRADYVFQHYRLGEALAAAASPADVDGFLEADGITHLLVDERLTLAALAERERRLLAGYLRARGVRHVLDPARPWQALWELRPGDADAGRSP